MTFRPVGLASARRPAQLPAAEHMKMQMIHALPCVATCIRHDAIAIGVQPMLARQLGRKPQQLPEQPFTLRAPEITNRSDMPGRYDQQMHRSLGIDVLERNGVLGPLHDLGRYFAGYNPAEQTVSHAYPAVVRSTQSQPRRAPRFRTVKY